MSFSCSDGYQINEPGDALVVLEGLLAEWRSSGSGSAAISQLLEECLRHLTSEDSAHRHQQAWQQPRQHSQWAAPGECPTWRTRAACMSHPCSSRLTDRPSLACPLPQGVQPPRRAGRGLFECWCRASCPMQTQCRRVCGSRADPALARAETVPIVPPMHSPMRAIHACMQTSIHCPTGAAGHDACRGDDAPAAGGLPLRRHRR